MDETELDALLINKAENIRYVTGFRGDDSWCVITRRSVSIITDRRYDEEIRSGDFSGTVYLRGVGKMLWDCIKEAVAQRRGRNAKLVCGVEAQVMTLDLFQRMKKACTDMTIKPTQQLVETVRMVKDATEIRCITRAVQVAQSALDRLLAANREEDLTEQEAGALLEYYLKAEGAESVSFPPIIAFGSHAALPHAVPRKRKIGRSGPLLIDFGAKIEGYCSDLTRTFYLGKISPLFSKRYAIMLEAQREALSVVRAGSEIGAIERQVRNYLKIKQVDQFFTHSIGHGVGLEVHEGPALTAGSKSILHDNMVITIEPGMYIKGWGGIRIEDMVLVTQKGYRLLSSYPYAPEIQR
jgi:Xaa-Pro aminopeptidase